MENKNKKQNFTGTVIKFGELTSTGHVFLREGFELPVNTKISPMLGVLDHTEYNVDVTQIPKWENVVATTSVRVDNIGVHLDDVKLVNHGKDILSDGFDASPVGVGHVDGDGNIHNFKLLSFSFKPKTK